MPRIKKYYQISPDEWLFPTHGDVLEAKRRAEAYEAQNGTLDGAELQIEEFVRQWALRQLLDAYKYPAEWVGERIIFSMKKLGTRN